MVTLHLGHAYITVRTSATEDALVQNTLEGMREKTEERDRVCGPGRATSPIVLRYRPSREAGLRIALSHLLLP